MTVLKGSEYSFGDSSEFIKKMDESRKESARLFKNRLDDLDACYTKNRLALGEEIKAIEEKHNKLKIESESK